MLFRLLRIVHFVLVLAIDVYSFLLVSFVTFWRNSCSLHSCVCCQQFIIFYFYHRICWLLNNRSADYHFLEKRLLMWHPQFDFSGLDAEQTQKKTILIGGTSVGMTGKVFFAESSLNRHTTHRRSFRNCIVSQLRPQPIVSNVDVDVLIK